MTTYAERRGLETLSTFVYKEEKGKILPQFAGNGLLEIKDNDRKIIWKPTGKIALCKTLYSDMIKPISKAHFGRPWVDVMNENSYDYSSASYGYYKSFHIDGYYQHPIGEDLLLIPYNTWICDPKMECAIYLIRDENGIYIQHYGLPLANDKYVAATSRCNYESMGQTDENMFRFSGKHMSPLIGGGVFGKVAPQEYERVKYTKSSSNFNEIQKKVNAYYAPLNEWWKKQK